VAADGAAGPAQLKPFTQVDNILNGIKRANNPLEQPIKFEFINLKAAKQFGITIPQTNLAVFDIWKHSKRQRLPE
jgi:ABC-type uncharacterized transport system substrate-binding protein